MEKIVIVGAGGFGREVKMLIDQINSIENKYEFLGFYDDGIQKGTVINHHKVLGSIDELSYIDYEINKTHTHLIVVKHMIIYKKRIISCQKNGVAG